MPFEPDKITKKHILDAVAYIDQENVELYPPTKYYVVINSKKYPPKEVMRYAHQQMNGELIWEKDGGSPTHKFLEPFGFETINKHKEMDNSTMKVIEQLLGHYSSYIETDDYDELYKWEAIQNFRDNWDIDSENFREMLDSSFQPESCNLWASGMYYPKKMLIEFADQYPEEVRDMFSVLFNEDKEFGNRIQYFKNQSGKLLKRIGKAAKNHYQDDRAISVYLAFHYPEKYFLYKYTMYKDFCDLTGIEPSPKHGSSKNIANYYQVCNKVKDIIEEHPDVIEKHKQLRGDEAYSDDSNHILTQDLIYCSSKDFFRDASESGDAEEDSNNIKKTKSSKRALNTVLYGPPGTGKTYKTLNYALSILEDNDNYLDDDSIDRETLRQKFEEYKKKRQIRFVTFHPSFTYEDFVEGIKPDLTAGDDEENTDVTYSIEPGIFKEICSSASEFQRLDSKKATGKPLMPNEFFESDQFHKISLGNSNKSEDDIIYNYCMENNLISIGFLKDVDCTGASDSEQIRKLAVEKGYDTKDFGIDALQRFKNWMKNGDIVFVSEGLNKLRAIGIIKDKNGEGYFYDPNRDIPYRHFRHVEWLLEDVEIPISDIYYKKFSQQTIYMISKDYINLDYFSSGNISEERGEKKFVLIIDEINRGNIPSIFGELITLLEKDKRASGKEPATIILPYSKESFTVPSNLYVIGTMNTADRSVEALDVALRRRFEFLPLYPNPEMIEQPEDLDVDLQGMLTAINDRIEYLLDRDHMIGHSYFMDLHEYDDPGDELKRIFSNNVVPLLEEYFYGQPDKIGLVLGKDFIEEKNNGSNVSSLFAKNFRSPDMPTEKKLYSLKDPMEFESTEPFRNIYE